MAVNDSPASEGQSSSDDAQRKLWFEYLAKLNDRDLQSARASGFTPWALAAVAVAIVYRCVPQIPSFLSTQDALKASVVILILEIDGLFHLGAGVAYLTYYCASGIEARLLTEPKSRAKRVLHWVGLTAVAAVIIAHFISSALLGRPLFVRGVLAGFGVYWLCNFIAAIRKEMRNVREAMRHRVPLPAFTVGAIGADLGAKIAAGLLLAIAALPLGTLFVFTRDLGKALWLLPLGAATQSLAVVSILLFLFVRALTSPARTIYATLERDIVLDNLAPSEIRSRFIREALGPTLGDWFESLNQKFCDAVSKIVELRNSAKPRLEEIASIDSQYPLEIAGRLKKLRDELHEGFTAQASELEGIMFQLEQVLETSPSTNDKEILRHIFQEWKSRTAQLQATLADAQAEVRALEGPAK